MPQNSTTFTTGYKILHLVIPNCSLYSFFVSEKPTITWIYYSKAHSHQHSPPIMNPSVNRQVVIFTVSSLIIVNDVLISIRNEFCHHLSEPRLQLPPCLKSLCLLLPHTDTYQWCQDAHLCFSYC